MEVQLSDISPSESDAGLVCIGLYDGDELPAPFADAPGSIDAQGRAKKLTMLRPEQPPRVLVVGLGKREKFGAEAARVAGAQALKQAKTLEVESIAWALPESDDPAATASGIVAGTILASYSFDRFQAEDPDSPRVVVGRLELLGADPGLADVVEASRVASTSANNARELQNLPSNVATPGFLADRATEIANAHEAVSLEVLERADMERLEMGGLMAVSAGTAEPPKLIVLRYAGGGSGETLGLVGKAVTFDSGGISIKPSGGMEEMKMDMSGGAAVLEAVDAIATLGLPIEIIACIPSTENMPSGTAVKPGDIISQYNGKTVEVINTDAEGRLILADALAYCVELGAGRVVDLATLTGAVLVGLGSTYAALISNDDDWAAEVGEAAEDTGELAWRLPLHEEYKTLTKGSITDLVNAAKGRKAGTIYAASFLEEFVGETPWVHLDIAGTAWDVGREYVGKGPTGYGVRLLVALASDLAGD